VVALLVAGAVGSALYVVAPPGPALRAVLAAARDLPSGAALTAGDVAAVRLPPDAVPAGVLAPGVPIEGLQLAGPMRRGELLTDVRILGAQLLDALASGPGGPDGPDGPSVPGAAARPSGDLVATPVRLADPGVAALLHAGQIVDVLAAAPQQLDPINGDPLTSVGAAGSEFGLARVVAAAVPVIAVPVPGDDGLLGSAPASDGPLVVLATTPATAAELAAAATSARLSVVIRSRAPP
jgi:Flp pilus assembly protein CpaB